MYFKLYYLLVSNCTIALGYNAIEFYTEFLSTHFYLLSRPPRKGLWAGSWRSPGTVAESNPPLSAQHGPGRGAWCPVRHRGALELTAMGCARPRERKWVSDRLLLTTKSNASAVVTGDIVLFWGVRHQLRPEPGNRAEVWPTVAILMLLLPQPQRTGIINSAAKTTPLLS